MTRKHILTASILSLTLAATAAVAAPVDVRLGAAGLDFATRAAAGHGYQLTVTGPKGFTAVETYEDGALPSFAAAGLDDGYYKYELTALLDEPAGGERTASIKAEPLASGTVLVTGGSFADTSLPEGGYLKDQVFIDDLIVDGSACIGIDCANGESFGFGTLRLKENNLRIKLDDPSGSSRCPNNDWQLTANDSSNGGANKFSLDDITKGKTPFTVEADTPSHTLYVASEGRIGVGTSTPVVGIHHKDGNTPTLRLEQDGSSGFTPPTWDLAGNETNFFVRDVTGGSKLPFRIKPGAGDDSIFIAADGDVGLGTDSPASALHVNRDTNNLMRLENTTAGGSARFSVINGDDVEWRLTNSATGTFRIAEQGTDTTTEFEIDGDGTVMLKEQTTAPASCADGSLYSDDSGALCFCASGSWVVAAGSGSCS